MPWFSAETDIKKLHQLSLQRGREFNRENGNAWGIMLQTILWPLLTFVQAFRNVFRDEAGFVARQENGPGRFRQFFQQLVLANRFNIRPDAYFGYYLWKDANYYRSSKYFLSPQFDGLLELLRKDADVSYLRDKFKFFIKCKSVHLPVAPILAVIHINNGISWLSEKKCLPHIDLFTKPIDRSFGDGAESWAYNGKGWSRNGVYYTEDILLKHLQGLAIEYNYILMPRLYNHPDIMQFTSGALATLRVVTCYTPGKSVVTIFSVLRMPVGSMEVDNFNAGGIAALIDKNGRLCLAAAMNINLGLFNLHPNTGATIQGAQLPFYKEACALCSTAHKVFPNISIIGWDIAITPDGPVILEANNNPGIETAQGAGGLPIGDTAFRQWANEHLCYTENLNMTS